MAQQTTDAWDEVRKIHHEHRFFYEITFGAFLICIVVLVGMAVFGANTDYFQELFMQGLGVIITIIILNRLAERREERRTERELKERLVMEVGSQSNETALRAVHELARREWLYGENGLLQGADLYSANLQTADLRFANLQGVYLGRANLQGAYLILANLQGAHFGVANLQGADLYHANLQGTKLIRANLQEANLWRAEMQGADLGVANLQDADLAGTRFDENTTLPDETKWTPDTDMTRFTDPQHPQFWRSNDKFSPAYRGKSDGG